MQTDAAGHSSVARADELFAQHRQQIYRSTDHLFERLMIVQWLAGIVAAFVIAPRTWSGQMSHIHIHVWRDFYRRRDQCIPNLDDKDVARHGPDATRGG